MSCPVPSPDMSCPVATCPVLSRHVCLVAKCPVLFRHVPSCPDMFRPVATCSVMSRHVLSCSDMSCPVAICSVLSRHVLPCCDMSCPVATCPILSRRVSHEHLCTCCSHTYLNLYRWRPIRAGPICGAIYLACGSFPTSTDVIVCAGQ